MEYSFTNISNNLIKKGYKVQQFNRKEAAAEYINKQIDSEIVGIGGSATIHQMGLYSLLSSHNTVYWHDEKH